MLDDQAGVESMMAELEDQAVQLRKASIEDGLLSSDFPLPYVTWSELSDQMQSLRGPNSALHRNLPMPRLRVCRSPRDSAMMSASAVG
jgi:hypothetical protein